MANKVDNGKIYDLIDRARLESKSDIIRVETKVDIVQSDVSDLKVNAATLNTKVYILVFIISSTISAIIAAASLRIFK